jgi:hypothetical protein
MRRMVRWLAFLICLGCLAKNVFGQESAWALAGFFAFGALWYYLTWKRTRELDAEKPFRTR